MLTSGSTPNDVILRVWWMDHEFNDILWHRGAVKIITRGRSVKCFDVDKNDYYFEQFHRSYLRHRSLMIGPGGLQISNAMGPATFNQVKLFWTVSPFLCASPKSNHIIRPRPIIGPYNLLGRNSIIYIAYIYEMTRPNGLHYIKRELTAIMWSRRLSDLDRLAMQTP